MARDGSESRKAANEMVKTRFRPCLSRAYCAAYSKVTQDLVAMGAPMPAGKEGPNHPGYLASGVAASKGVREMIVQRLTNLDLKKRRALSELVGELCTLQLYADYRPSIDVSPADAREAVVAPTQRDERASQHAHLMTEIERTLFKEGYDQVLLIPAVPEHAGLIDVPDAAS